MECPVCQHPMTQEDFGGVDVDVCVQGCGGLWFDYAELDRVKRENETAFTDALKKALDGKVSGEAPRDSVRCPHCQLVLHQHLYTGGPGIRVDECYGCGGFFLDAGELRAIRECHMSPETRSVYINQMLQEVPEYAVAQASLARKEQRSRAVRAIGNFVLPFGTSLW